MPIAHDRTRPIAGRNGRMPRRMARAVACALALLTVACACPAIAGDVAAVDSAATLANTPPAIDAPSLAPPTPESAAPSSPEATTVPVRPAPRAAAPRSAPAPEPSPAPAPVPPATLVHLDPWLEYQRAARLTALPDEARIFYRRALVARESGDAAGALRLARGAQQLDPTLLAARLTLIRWQLLRAPSQSLAELLALVRFVREDFPTQWSLAANALWWLAGTWSLAILVLGLLILIARCGELLHLIHDRLTRWLTPGSARAWSVALIVAPFALHWGVALPVVGGLGMLWPVLRPRERAAWLLLVATVAAQPFAAPLLGRAALPMRAGEPLAAVMTLADTPPTPARAAEIAALAEAHPDDPFAAFATGWVALQSGHGPAAEAAYRDVLRRWPDDDRAHDDLGTALVLQGRRAEAIPEYQQAIAAAPSNATAHFNLAQAHLADYDFATAGRLMDRASALDFDRVRAYERQPAANGALAPVPDWLAASRAWRALWAADGAAAMPPLPRGFAETTDARYAWLALALAVVTVLLGRAAARRLPLHRCANCDHVVCRRCSERRRTQVLCTACARSARGAASPEFARVLLARAKERRTRFTRGVALALALAMPGAGLVLRHRVWRPLLLLLAGAGIVMASAGWPYAGRPRVGMRFDVWHWDTIVPLAIVWAIALFATLAHERAARRTAAAKVLEMRKRPMTRPSRTTPPGREAA